MGERKRQDRELGEEQGGASEGKKCFEESRGEEGWKRMAAQEEAMFQALETHLSTRL